MATHFSILAWRIPWTEKPDRLQSMGLQRVGHNWATNTFTKMFQLKASWQQRAQRSCQCTQTRGSVASVEKHSGCFVWHLELGNSTSQESICFHLSTSRQMYKSNVYCNNYPQEVNFHQPIRCCSLSYSQSRDH